MSSDDMREFVNQRLSILHKHHFVLMRQILKTIDIFYYTKYKDRLDSPKYLKTG